MFTFPLLPLNFLFFLATLSFSYGFYRGWTLLWRHDESKLIKIGISTIVGVTYIIPPISVFKYRDLIYRIYYHSIGFTDERCTRELYHELDMYHPNVV